jgi:hypothetical protein
MDGREPQEREKETCFRDRTRYCAARKHMIHVSLLDTHDWSEKRGTDWSIFNSSRLRQPLQKIMVGAYNTPVTLGLAVIALQAL